MMTLFKIFLPDLSLAFEYQGETHYFSSHIFGRATDRQRNDNIKLQYAREMGITLISIPFWWKKSLSALSVTIQSHRPDLILDHISLRSPPIPSEMPLDIQQKFRYVPNSASYFKRTVDPTGW